MTSVSMTNTTWLMFTFDCGFNHVINLLPDEKFNGKKHYMDHLCITTDL